MAEAQNIPPQTNLPPSEPNLDEPGRNRFMQLAINVLTFVVLVGVVIASFWVSFQLGKKVLVPTKELPKPKIAVPIPEAPPSIKAMQKLQALMSSEAGKVKRPKSKAKKAAAAAVSQPAPVAEKNVAVPAVKPAAKRVKKAFGNHYYKVQAGVFADLESAKNLAEKIKAAGFDVFVKKVSAGWRVQAGALKTNEQANAVVEKLKNQGFKAEVIFE